MPDMENTAHLRTGNVQRAKWRQKCRHRLSDYLNDQLGLVVEPAQVRLRPNAEDGYTWAPLPGKEHLFAKQLSKHSVGVYMELCREVGKTFEAVASPASVIESLKKDSTATGAATFSSKILGLQEENVKLTYNLSRTRQEAEADSAARLDAVQQAQQLRLDLRAAQTLVEKISEENDKLTSKVRRLTKRIARFEREVKKASLTLQRLSPALTDDEDVQQ